MPRWQRNECPGRPEYAAYATAREALAALAKTRTDATEADTNAVMLADGLALSYAEDREPSAEELSAAATARARADGLLLSIRHREANARKRATDALDVQHATYTARLDARKAYSATLAAEERTAWETVIRCRTRYVANALAAAKDAQAAAIPQGEPIAFNGAARHYEEIGHMITEAGFAEGDDLRHPLPGTLFNGSIAPLPWSEVPTA